MISDQKPPLSVEISAKASLSVSAEIPKESAGRTLDALVDLIRPFTERQGLKGDLIRLQREDVALEIAKKATERAKLYGLELNPVPNKILVPLFEKGSLEEDDSPLIDWWAGLLVSAAGSGGARPYLTELISHIGVDEARLLDRLWGAFCKSPGFDLNSALYRHFLAAEIIRRVELIVRRESKLDDDEWRDETLAQLERLARNFVSTTESAGAVVEISLPRGVGRGEIGSESLVNDSEALDVCRALNLLGHGIVVQDFNAMGLQQNYQITIINFTDLGIEFMKACRPDAIVGHWCLDE